MFKTFTLLAICTALLAVPAVSAGPTDVLESCLIIDVDYQPGPATVVVPKVFINQVEAYVPGLGVDGTYGTYYVSIAATDILRCISAFIEEVVP